jgi:hypothetical protein
MPMAVYAKGSNEHTHVMEDSKDTSTQEICAKLVSKVVQVLACARYTFQNIRLQHKMMVCQKLRKLFQVYQM